MKINIKNEKIIWIVFWILVFAGLSVFFQKYHPLTIFDTDDWTYVKFTRRHGGVFPSTGEFNPIKVLPENMTAVAGFFGAYVVKFFNGDYVRSLEISYGLFLCASITAYFFMIVIAIDKMFPMRSFEKLVLAIFIVFIHFIPFLHSGVNNAHYFYEGDANGIYNNTIPALINAVAICYSIIYEKEICEFEFKKHRILLGFYVILIYLSINSNLFSNVLIASYAVCKLAQYLKDSETLSKAIHKGRYCLFILVLWCGSLILEYKGGRAAQVGQDNLDIEGSIGQLWSNLIKMNKFYLAGMLILLGIAIVLCVRKKNILLFSQFAVITLIATIYNILLAAKTDKGYLSRSSVNLTCSFGLMMISYMVIAIIIREKKVLITVAAVTAVLSIIIVFGDSTYAEINAGGYPHEKCTEVSRFIIKQYMAAYEAGKTSVEIRVPMNENDPANFPFCEYGAERIASNLWWHGMTRIRMEAVFIPDKTVNDIFDL